jgi:L-glutamine:2-deoxy-scyllo-inosose/3-amino-2,3-dideoxy-scyllo-inosose aminotransferase
MGIPETAVDRNGWPVWPLPSPRASDLLNEVLFSGRWSISGAATGQQPMERRFAAAFAQWMDVRHCVPTSNGTSALVGALLALDVGVGDEVIVPGLTWVAPAVAVLQANATPVLTDIDPRTLCISPQAIERALTPRTRAIIAVHLYSSVAELAEIRQLIDGRGIALIEDCAQSHGSVYGGRKVGAWGDIGIFSMHQGKPLTCGEGGAAVTNNDALAGRMEQLRANGRRYCDPPSGAGDFDLREVGQVLGTNMALSEFQAALLLDGLAQLDEQNRLKARAAAYLDAQIRSIDGVFPLARPPQADAQSYYHYVVRFHQGAFGALDAAAVAEKLTSELGCPWQRTYAPLNRHPLYNTQSMRRLRLSTEFLAAIDATRTPLPACEYAYESTLIVHHRVLLAGKAMLERIPEALSALARRH